MPLPAAVLAAIVAAAKGASAVTAITGTASDVISLGFTIADQMKAQEGLKYNPYVFKMERKKKLEQESEKPPASMATRSGKKGNSSASNKQSSPINDPSAELQRISETAGSTTILEIKSGDAHARFGINFYYVSDSETSALVGVVNLWSLKGFDSAVGDQAEIQFSGIELDGSHLLNITGMVNKWLSGFMRFSGEIIIRNDQPGVTRNQVQPLRENKVGQGASLSRSQHGFIVSV